MSRTFITIYIGMLLGLGPAAIDSYAPLMGLLQEGLTITAEQSQLGLTAILLAMGAGQLIAGPLADRYGRTKLLYAGLSIYFGGALICALADTLSILLVGRTLQGLGAATGQIIGRAILRDLYSGTDLAHMTSGSTAVMATIVVLSPVAGYLLAIIGGWEITFIALALFSAVLLGTTRLSYHETLAKPDVHALHPTVMWHSTLAVWRHPQSRRFLLVLVVGGLSMFHYVISAQYVYAQAFSITGGQFALFYCLVGLGVIIGQLINRKLIHLLGTAPTIVIALIFSLIALLIGLLFANIGILNGYGYAAVMFCFAMGFMVCVSNSIALTIDPHGTIAGFTSSLVGTLTFALGSVGGTVLALTFDSNATATLAMMAVWIATALALVLHWLWQVRHWKYSKG